MPTKHLDDWEEEEEEEMTVREETKSSSKSKPEAQPLLPDVISSADNRPLKRTMKPGNHPDTVLRSLGIIEQIGVWSGKKVQYNPRLEQWVTSRNEPAFSKGGNSYNPLKDKKRVDFSPRGAILLVGDVDFNSLQGQTREYVLQVRRKKKLEQQSLLQYRGSEGDASKHTRKKHWAIQEEDKKKAGGNATKEDADVDFGDMNQESGIETALRKVEEEIEAMTGKGKNDDGGAAANPNPNQGGLTEDQHQSVANLGDVESDGTFLSPEEASRFLKQYIVRSIPSAALRANAIIFTSATGPLTEKLAEGIKGLSDVSSGRSDVQVVSILPEWHLPDPDAKPKDAEDECEWKEKDGPEPEFEPAFTHHVMLKDAMVRQVREFTNTLLCYLNNGHLHDTKSTKPDPPTREMVPVCVVVCGGDTKATRFELVAAVKRQWPIFVVEGSGGYADQLATVLKECQKDDGEMYRTHEERCRHYTSGLDALTAEIVRKGKCIVVPQAQVVDHFTQSIVYSLKGDAMLRQAWQKYALWKQNSEKYRWLFKNHMLGILLVGILSTGLSIFQTTMQVVWPLETKEGVTQDTPGVDTQVYTAYNVLNLIVIFLPILMQLMQTVTNKINAGGKWVALRWAAEGAAHELYAFRTQVEDYSKARVRAAARRHALNKETESERQDTMAEGMHSQLDEPETAEDYSTRQELLSLRLEKLTKELTGALGGESLEEYKGTLIPPSYILAMGDDGFTDLTPDRYIDARLIPKIREYTEEAQVFATQRKVLEMFIHVFNTLGTLLAAIATYEFLNSYNLQAWVSFTTAIVFALTRFEHWMMLDWHVQKWNETHQRLSSMITWWSSRGARTESSGGDSPNELIHKCEAIMKAEVAEFRKQLKVAVEDSRKAADDMEQMKDEATGKKNDEEVSQEKLQAAVKAKEMNVSQLTVEGITKALADPSGSGGKQIRRLMKDLNSEFGDPILAAKNKLKQNELAVDQGALVYEDFNEIKGEFTDEHGVLVIPPHASFSPFEFRKLLPVAFKDAVEDSQKRNMFLSPLLAKSSSHQDVQFSRKFIMQMAKKTMDHKLVNQMHNLPMRIMLEGVIYALEMQLKSMLVSSLLHVGLQVYELVPQRELLDEALEDIRTVACFEWRNLDRNTILRLVNGADLRAKLESLPEPKLRALLKRVEAYTIDSERNHSEGSELLGYAVRLRDEAADIDKMNAIIPSDSARVEMAIPMESMQLLRFPMSMLPKEDLLGFFPDPLQQHLAKIGQPMLAACAERLRLGRPLTRVLRGLLARKAPATTRSSHDANGRPTQDHIKLDKDSHTGDTQLDMSLHTARRKEQFVLGCRTLTQQEIFTASKAVILKRMQGCKVVESRLVEELRVLDQEKIKNVMSHLRSACGNSYVGRLFDQLNDEIASFDMNKIMAYEESVLLFRRMKEFHGVDIALMQKDKIISVAAYREVVRRFRPLYEDQLQEMMERIIVTMSSSLSSHYFNTLVPAIKSAHARAVLEGLSGPEVDRLCVALSQMDYIEDMKAQANRTKDDSEQAEKLLDQIEDLDVLSHLRVAQLDAEDLPFLINRIHEEMGDIEALFLFRQVARHITDGDMMSSFESIFAHKHMRSEFLNCLIDLVEVYGVHILDIDTLISHMHDHEIGEMMKNADIKDPNAEADGIQSPELTDHDYAMMVRALKQAFGDQFGEMMITLFAHTISHTPYYLFHTLAVQHKTFNLREVIKGVASRHQLVPLVCELIHLEAFSNKRVNVEIDPQLITKKNILSQCDRMPDATRFEDVIADIRIIPEAPLVELVQKAVMLLASGYRADIGTLYLQIYRVRRGVAQQHKEDPKTKDFAVSEMFSGSEDWAIALFYIRSVILLKPYEVRDTLDNFDTRVFCARMESERMERFLKFIPTERLANKISKMSDSDTKQFFAYLKATPLFLLRRSVTSTGQGDTENETHKKLMMKKAQKTMNRVKAAGAYRYAELKYSPNKDVQARAKLAGAASVVEAIQRAQKLMNRGVATQRGQKQGWEFVKSTIKSNSFTAKTLYKSMSGRFSRPVSATPTSQEATPRVDRPESGEPAGRPPMAPAQLVAKKSPQPAPAPLGNVGRAEVSPATSTNTSPSQAGAGAPAPAPAPAPVERDETLPGAVNEKK